MEVAAIIISVIALGISVVTMFFNHKKATERDLNNKKREVRVGYYIKAFMLFTSVAEAIETNRYTKESETPKFNRAYYYIQLLGDKEIIETWDKYRELVDGSNNVVIHPSIINDILICTMAKIRADLGLSKKDIKITCE